MKKRLFKKTLYSFSTLIFSILPSLAIGAGCIPIPMDLFLEPYIGVDGEGRNTNFAPGFGKKVFKQDYPEINVYLGLKFNDYIGIEGGYRVSTTETLVSSLGGGETASGIPVQFPPAVHRGTASYKGWHGDLVGFLPIMLPDCVYLLGSIGFSRVELFARDKLVQNQSGVGTVAFTEGEFVRTFKKTQTVLTLATGLQIQLDEKSSIRFKIGWENTAGLKSIAPQEDNGGLLKPRDSIIYGIGILINFL